MSKRKFAPGLVLGLIVQGITCSVSFALELPPETATLLVRLTEQTKLEFREDSAQGTLASNPRFIQAVISKALRELNIHRGRELNDIEFGFMRLRRKENISFILDNNVDGSSNEAAAKIVELITHEAKKPLNEGIEIGDCVAKNTLFVEPAALAQKVEEIAATQNRVQSSGSDAVRLAAAPEISVQTLFSEIVAINPEDESFEGWKPYGLRKELDRWPQSNARQQKLAALAGQGVKVLVPNVNPKPILLTEDTREFFSGLKEGVPFDGSFVAYKYLFYPKSVMDPGKYSDLDAPIEFYLVKDAKEISPEEIGHVPNKNSVERLTSHYEQICEAYHGETEANYQHGANLTENDPNLAAHFLKCASKRAHADASFDLGMIHYSGSRWNEKSDLKARQYLEVANQQGNASASFYLGRLYQEGGAERVPDFSRALQHYTSAANTGHLEANNALGQMYLEGKGTAPNLDVASQYFYRAARDGHEPSIAGLLELAQNGHINSMYRVSEILLETHPENARHFARLASEAGHASAQNLLGYMHHAGAGGPKDHNQAIIHFARSAHHGNETAISNLKSFAEAGDAEAQFQLGVLYLQCEKVEQDIPLGLEYLSASAKGNNPKAHLFFGEMEEDKDQSEDQMERTAKFYYSAIRLSDPMSMTRERAWERLEASAARGSAIANYFLGLAKLGFAEDEEHLARHYFSVAVEHGHARSAYVLAQMVSQGLGGPTDPARAAELYQLSSDKGNGDASHALAVMNVNGDGIPKDREKAKLYYKRAVNAGVEGADYRLGLLWFEENNPDSQREAFPLIEAAANTGNADAMLLLFVMYGNGLGTEKSHQTAIKWLKQAHQAGNPEAAKILEEYSYL